MSSDEARVFLDRFLPSANEVVLWPGDLLFHVQTLLTPEAPPGSLLTSARAVVLRGDAVLVLTDQSPSTHILPGGRIEHGEAALETVVREVGEESGWKVRPLGQIGVRHFRHLQPRPAGYPYAYPDFFQAVYVAAAEEYRAELRESGGWETAARFIPARDAINLGLTAGEQVLLIAALEALHEASDKQLE